MFFEIKKTKTVLCEHMLHQCLLRPETQIDNTELFQISGIWQKHCFVKDFALKKIESFFKLYSAFCFIKFTYKFSHRKDCFQYKLSLGINFDQGIEKILYIFSLNEIKNYIIKGCAVLSISNEVSFGKNFQNASYGTQNSSSFKNIPKFVETVVQKLNDCIQLYDQIHDQTLSNDARKDIQRLKINQIISNTNFIQTLLNWYILLITKGLEPLNFETLRILSKLSHIDNLISGDSNSKEKLCALRIYLPTWTLDQDCIQTLVEIVTQESKSVNWKSRQASIQMVRNFSILNSFILSEEQKCQIKQILLNLIVDENLQVRQSTCLVLGSMFHADFIKVDSEIINHFIKLTKINIKNNEFGHSSNQTKVIQCHGGILGLCAIVNSSPNEIPDNLPDVITHLCQFCHHIEPIKGSVKKCLSEFKRTHLDNWSAHKLKFTSEQLSMLNDTMLSGNYFA
ncbi:proteasome activator complex subunit 4-like [Brachionus plicatilis]|uniref:Proteasome activator complex subunit 4-like n=1 Tax=Brachionus plicatilis TaxID=10195 RepID=A0A3M7PHQ6_BRAPC|nr:proteasome activator complex subunit 4-like [Brachionus plicatilis]